MSRCGVSLVWLSLAGLTLLMPEPAAADTFIFGYASGHRHSHWSRHHHYRHDHYGYRPSYWTGHRHYYRPPPLVHVPPPVVYYTPPPPVVVYPSPPMISAVPSSPVYVAPNGQYCREYQGSVTVNGYMQPSYGTACLGADGAWRVVK